MSLSSSTEKIDVDVLNSTMKSSTHSPSSLIPPATDIETITRDINEMAEPRIPAHDFHATGPIFSTQRSSSTSVTNIFEVDVAISQYSHSIDHALKSVPHLSTDTGALGILHFKRFRETSDPDELEKSIKYLGTAVVLLRHQSTQDSQLPILFYCLACAFQSRFYLTHDFNDLDQAIPHYEDAIKFADKNGSENLVSFYSDLGSAFQARFERRGGVSDVEGAVHNHRRALQVASDLEEALVPTLTSNLGISYQSRFERLGETSDLEQAILNLRQSVDISSFDDPHLPGRLNNLGLSLQSRFEFNEKNLTDPESPSHNTFCDHGVNDLEEAIQTFMKAAKQTNFQHPEWIANLGTAYRLKAEKEKDIAVLNEAISILQVAVDLSKDPTTIYHDFLPKFLGKLAICLTVKAHLADQGAIDDAITHFKRSLELTPEGHDTERSAILLRYGDALHIRFKETHDVEDAMGAIATFQECSELPYGPIMGRLQAAIRWAQIAHEDGEFMIALKAYATAIDLLPQAAWIGQSVTSRRRILASQPATLAADAAACAIEKGAYPKAVELLEQGRTIFWNQALQLRPDLRVLLAINRPLAEELEAVARELEPRTFEDSFHAQAHATQLDMEDSAQHYRALAKKWQRLVDTARKLPDLQDFLKPRPFSQLKGAATCGPVIIANASSYRCDALIVQKDGRPIHIPLPKASFNTLTEQARAVNPQSQRGTGFNEAITTLWETVLSPITQNLSTLFAHELEEGRMRVWWCPTGPLTFFPLHMAGSTRGALKTDSFIPSYTSNLGSLIRARESLPRVIRPIHMLLVGVPAASGFSKLPGVQKEIHTIQEMAESRGIPTKLLKDEAATKDAVNSCLPDTSWAHFACHGGNSSLELGPFTASLYLQDSPLSLADIAKHRLPTADFGFFSACDTATAWPGKALPEEALHLAAGFQFAGFRSLIATMWNIYDDMAVHVSQEVYGHLFGNELVDSSEAAKALDSAVRRLVAASRSTVGDSRSIGVRILSKGEKEIIADGRLIPFVHFGI